MYFLWCQCLCRIEFDVCRLRCDSELRTLLLQIKCSRLTCGDSAAIQSTLHLSFIYNTAIGTTYRYICAGYGSRTKLNNIGLVDVWYAPIFVLRRILTDRLGSTELFREFDVVGRRHLMLDSVAVEDSFVPISLNSVWARSIEYCYDCSSLPCSAVRSHRPTFCPFRHFSYDWPDVVA